MDLQNNSNISQINNELLCLQISPGIVNIILLTIGLCQMYFGIEIAHPVYAVLFVNLLVTLLSSVIDVFIFPFVTILKYAVLVNGNNTMCFLFHFCSWCVLSFLRYMYIVNSKWLHKTFPNAKIICVLAIFNQFLIFVLTFGTVLGTVMSFGWPYKRPTDLTSRQRLVSSATILAIYFSLVGTSCFFYILILRKRGKLGINNVGILDKDSGLANEVRETFFNDRLTNNDRSKNKDNIKPDPNLSDFQTKNYRRFNKQLIVGKVIPKTEINKRCLSCPEVLNLIFEETIGNCNQTKRCKSVEEVNIYFVDKNSLSKRNIDRSNLKSENNEECRIISDEEDKNSFELEAERREKAKQLERRNAEINAAMRYKICFTNESF